MNEPKRLAGEEGTDLERLLLDAARRERPRSSLVPRMLAGLGLGVGLTQTAVPLAAAAKIGVGVWVSVAILAAAGTGFFGARSFAINASSPPPVAAPPNTVRETAAPVTKDAELRDEIRLLDRARAALGMHTPQRALQELRQYFDDHPRGMLEPEAAVLYVEALRESGLRVQAAVASREFLARHPDGPLADRVRRLADK